VVVDRKRVDVLTNMVLANLTLPPGLLRRDGHVVGLVHCELVVLGLLV
jgi:hypothetical protein